MGTSESGPQTVRLRSAPQQNRAQRRERLGCGRKCNVAQQARRPEPHLEAEAATPPARAHTRVRPALSYPRALPSARELAHAAPVCARVSSILTSFHEYGCVYIDIYRYI